MNTRHLVPAVPAAALLLAGCDDQQPPTTVIVNTLPADAGLSVLLTVMVVAAFLALIATGLFAWAWASERRARREVERSLRIAEDTVLALTGHPVKRIHPTAHVGQVADRPAVTDLRRLDGPS